MAAATTLQPMKAATPYVGMTIPNRSDLEEAASQTYKAGAVLVLSAGTLEQGSGAPGTGITGGVVGISECDGQNLSAAGFYPKEASNQGPMYVPALPFVIFEANLCSVTSSEPDVAHTLAITDIGTAVAVSLSAISGLPYWFLDVTASGNKIAQVIGLKDPVGTVNGRVYFMFLLTTTFTIYA